MEKVTKTVVDGVDMIPLVQFHYALNQMMMVSVWQKKFPHLEANGLIDTSTVRKNKRIRSEAMTQFWYEVSATLSDLQDGKAFELWSNDYLEDEQVKTN